MPPTSIISKKNNKRNQKKTIKRQIVCCFEMMIDDVTIMHILAPICKTFNLNL